MIAVCARPLSEWKGGNWPRFTEAAAACSYNKNSEIIWKEHMFLKCDHCDVLPFGVVRGGTSAINSDGFFSLHVQNKLKESHKKQQRLQIEPFCCLPSWKNDLCYSFVGLQSRIVKPSKLKLFQSDWSERPPNHYDWCYDFGRLLHPARTLQTHISLQDNLIVYENMNRFVVIRFRRTTTTWTDFFTLHKQPWLSLADQEEFEFEFVFLLDLPHIGIGAVV